MRIYGLTGGIGSGKSEAAHRFCERGVPVIDADALGHEVLAPGGSAAQDVTDAFGPDILTDGIIDRKKVAARVFGDPGALRRLNTIVHPAIYRVIAERCAALAQSGHRAAIVEAALLAENGVKETFFDGLIVVMCPESLRVERLVAQRGMTRQDAAQRIAAQSDPGRKLAIADWVIVNDGARDHLHAQVDRIVAEMNEHHGGTTG